MSEPVNITADPPAVAPSGATETPWGVTWKELLPTLRPTPEHASTVAAIIDEVRIALARAEITPSRVIAGGCVGRGTHSAGDTTLALYAVFDDAFDATRYLDAYLRPFIAALSATPSGASHCPFTGVEERGLSVLFCMKGMDVRLFAAGVLYSGPKQLLLMNDTTNIAQSTQRNDKKEGITMTPREVHVQTSCEVLRTLFLAAQPPLYKDLVRVARKWRDGLEFESENERPSDLLIEMIMLEAFESITACTGVPKPDVYASAFRRFLTTLAAQPASGSHIIGGIEQPKTFLSWPTLYNQGAIEWSRTNGLMVTRKSDADLIVIDPAVPYLDIGQNVTEWIPLRRYARSTLEHFQSSELVEALQAKLAHFSVSVEETLSALRARVDALNAVECSARRWSGSVAFSEVHLASDTWVKVELLELRTFKWHINVRRSRSDTTGYSRTADVSLQIVGLREQLKRTIDVDVSFQGHTAQLVFGPGVDHVSIVKRSEILRNKKYTMQITVIA